jgi:hypothetical protein
MPLYLIPMPNPRDLVPQDSTYARDLVGTFEPVVCLPWNPAQWVRSEVKQLS